MDSFRAFVRKHLSKSSLVTLFLFGLVFLGVSGKAFVTNVDTLFADIDRDVGPSVHVALVSSPGYKYRLPTTPPPSKKLPIRNLSKGNSGEEVKNLQEFLKWRGFWPKNEETTGYFGDTTKERLIEYQKWQNIDAEGVVGPKTIDAWRKDLSKSQK